jgi:hypothetical protein
MAAYSTSARVEKLMTKAQVGAGRPLETVDVDEFLEDVSAEIDTAFASRGFAVPITAPDYLLRWVEKLATEGAAATTLKALYQSPSGPNSEGAWAVYERRYQKGIDEIRSGRFVPTELNESSGALPSSLSTREPGEHVAAFSRGRVF